jgi:aminoglycoside phosphotransferase family enzyme/predicted kinase
MIHKAAVGSTNRDEAPYAVKETNISILFFMPDRVYKLLKPIRMTFVDFSSPARRVAAAHRELELNRRLALDVYLGEADVREGDELVDRMIVMRRLPDDRRLSTLVDSPDFSDHLDAVARAVATFHAHQPPVTEPVPLSTAGGLAGFWRSSFEDLKPFIGPVLDRDEFDEVQHLALDYLDHSGRLFDGRRRAGHVRDGHGDLIAEDIFMLPDGPRILDCLAFDDDYRVSDVLADIAFLVMDVERLAGREPARRLMQSYCKYSNEHHPSSLAHHYVAYRAHVRAKVSALRWSQGDVTARDVARSHHSQACDHLRRARTTVVLLGGGPGTGKTTLAGRLGERLGWLTIDSDTLRKDLRRIDHDDHRVALHPDLYSVETTEATYRLLVGRAATLIRAGESVILDATWASGAHREMASRMTDAEGVRLVEIECDLDPDLARRRIADRQRSAGNVSDATPGLVGTYRDAWPSAIRADTADAVESVCDELIVRLVGE